MFKGRHASSGKKGYSTKGEGGHQFSMAEPHPRKSRSTFGSVKDSQAGQNAATQMGAQNLLPSFEDAARAEAAED